MQTKLHHPVLNVFINGIAAKKRPSSFGLITDREYPSVMATLCFPGDTEIGKIGDRVTVSLRLEDEEHLLFTGEIYSVIVGKISRILDLADGYKKLCDTSIIAAYRKETASVILQDTLDKAGIGKTAITCPAVEIARFSTENIPADMCIKQLITALEEHGHKGLRFFFDEKDIFHFGTTDDTGKNNGTVYEFESGKNIIKLFNGWMEVLPLPIRGLQEVKVNGVKLITSRTDLHVSGTYSRLRLWLKRFE
jgi:hypothetical protein